jgi:hypothetical protein
MRCELFSDAHAFGDVAVPFLATNEAENTVVLGDALRCAQKPQGDAVMAVVRDGEIVRLVAVMTPPYPPVVSAVIPRRSRIWSRPCAAQTSGRRPYPVSSRWPSVLRHCGAMARRANRYCGWLSTVPTASRRQATG